MSIGQVHAVTTSTDLLDRVSHRLRQAAVVLLIVTLVVDRERQPVNEVEVGRRPPPTRQALW